LEKVQKAEVALQEEKHKGEFAAKASGDKIGSLEQAYSQARPNV
jgi:hypothetical protein